MIFCYIILYGMFRFLSMGHFYRIERIIIQKYSVFYNIGLKCRFLAISLHIL